MYVLPDPEPVAPTFTDPAFAMLGAKVTYYEGEEINLRWASESSELDENDNVKDVTVTVDVSDELPNLLMLKGYMSVTEGWISFKLDLEKDPELANQTWKAVFTSTDGDLTTEKIVIFDFRPPSDEIL